MNRSQSLVQLFRQAKEPAQRLKIASELYAHGGSLDKNLELRFFGELVKNGQTDLALRIWKSSRPPDAAPDIVKWRSTGVSIYALANNLMEARALAGEGIDANASKDLEMAHKRQKQIPLSSMSLLNTRNAELKTPTKLASILAAEPDLLDSPQSILRALSVSKVRDDPFWQENHPEAVRDELLHQGIAPHEDTALTIDRCLSLMEAAIRQKSISTAAKLFANRPANMDDTCKGRQLLLKFYFFRKQWRPLFDLMHTPSNFSWRNWRLVWEILAQVYKAPPLEQPPHPRELYNEMVSKKGYPLRNSLVLDVVKCFIHTKDFAFLLAMLRNWTAHTQAQLPKPLIHYLSHLRLGSVAQLGGQTPREIVFELCRQNEVDFAIIEQNSQYL